MITTIKIDKKTKDRLLSLDLATKDKTFDMMINDLVTSYEKNTKDWKKSMNKYKESAEEYEKSKILFDKEMNKYWKEKQMWQKLLRWAKTKGFRE